MVCGSTPPRSDLSTSCHLDLTEASRYARSSMNTEPKKNTRGKPRKVPKDVREKDRFEHLFQLAVVGGVLSDDPQH